MTEPLREYELHIKDNYPGNAGKAWCGTQIHRHDVVFDDIDHAAMSGRQGGRHLPCPACLAAVVAALGVKLGGDRG